MGESLLQQLSAERVAVLATLERYAVGVAVGRQRIVSGIRWRAGYVISAAEAVAGVERVGLYGLGPEAVHAEVVAIDLTTDVAVMRAPEAPLEPQATPPTRPAEAALRLGEFVTILGRDTSGPRARSGMVCLAGPAWQSRRGGRISQRLEFDVSMDARLEGALVADTAGRMVAMLVCGPGGRALGIPVATIEATFGPVERHGYLPRPYLGVRLQTLWLDSEASERFARRSRRIALVAGIDAGSPAAAAGLAPGDLISSIDGQEAEGVDAVIQRLAGCQPGQTLTLELRRGGALDSRTLTVAERPRPR